MSLEEEVEVGFGWVKKIKAMSWGLILKCFVVITLFFVAVGYWEEREAVYKHVNMELGRFGPDHIPSTISEKTKAEIQFTVDRSTTIVAAELVNIDFTKNEKQPVYFYSDKASFGAAMEEYKAKKISNSPLLVSGDIAANERVVSIVNGDFVCIPIPDKFKVKVPIASKFAVAVCSISVPPYYGQIVGYINIWIDHMPKEDEIPDYRAIARSMSVNIYERDIKGN